MDGIESKLVSLVSEFIEEQKNKDLLDVSGYITLFHMVMAIELALISTQDAPCSATRSPKCIR